MPNRFLKIDLSAASRDFEHFALEPGAPLLDRDGMNRRILQKWLGRLVADPEWKDLDLPLDDDQAAFFVSPGEGQRLHDVACEPVTRTDIERTKSLHDDLEALRTGLKNAKPTSTREEKLRGAAIRNFNAALSADGPPQHEFCFFKYRDGKDWRLVWGWGYQRRDRKVSGSAVICTNPQCRQLFVKRQDGGRDCPGCNSPAAAGARGSAPSSGKRRGMLALLALLLMLAAGAGYLLRDRWQPVAPSAPETHEHALVVSPATWKGPQGSPLEFKIERRGADGQLEDVTRQVVSVAENPKVVRVEAGGGRIVARAHGKTAVHFYLGDLAAHATVDVEPRENPRTIRLDPAEFTLGIGTTQQVKVLAEYGEGPAIEVTESVEWDALATPLLAGHGGRFEGIAAGEVTIGARYRVSADDPYRTAQARVRVVAEKYARLEVSVDPNEIVEGNSGRLSANVFDEGGQSRSVLQSSLLRLELDDSGVAELDRDGLLLLGRKAGKGQVRASFGTGLNHSTSFQVKGDVTGRFAVTPKDLRLMVGEIVELQITTASAEPVQIVSATAGIVEILPEGRIIGRMPGKTELTVTQEAREEKVEVEVTTAALASIAFVPPRVAVPLDRAATLRLVGRTADGQEFDLAPDAFVWEKVPPPEVAEIDVRSLELRGRSLTGDTPQEAVARLGELRAVATIDVTNAPLQIELTPAGPVALPEGQTVALQAWARYGDGNRTEIEAGRLEWQTTPAAAPGLRFDPATGSARSVKAGDTLLVSARYQGYESNRVELRSTYEELPLSLEADRRLIVVGDRGQLRASVRGAPAEFALSGVKFESSAPAVLQVDPQTGAYRALSVGQATVTATHPNSKTPATATFDVAEEAQLVIRPEKIQLLVHGRQPLQVFLVAGGREEQIPLVDATRAPRISLAQPDAVRWQAPHLVGLSAAAPFNLVVEYGGKTARAVVEVVSGGGNLRVAPDHVKLSPGQAHSPQVEQQLPGGNQWQEIEPTRVAWDVPEALRWTPARGELRPQVVPTEAAQGKLTLAAKYGDQEAKLTIEVGEAAKLAGPLEVVREPAGESLEVDELQRYAIVVRQGDQAVPAANVRWQAPFENDYVRWAPPVLYAKRPGHDQLLSAQVGDQTISFRTRTVETAAASNEPPLPLEPPAEVRIVCAVPQPVTLPLRARFDEFRVEAVYPGRPAVDVTRDAQLEIVATGEAPYPVTIVAGQVLAIRVGAAEIRAAYRGVAATNGLHVEVVQEEPLAELSPNPRRVRLEVGESATVRVIGIVLSKGERRSVGDVSGLPDVTWTSETPAIATVQGPRVTGVAVGQTKVTVAAGAASTQFEVEVVPSSARIGGESLIVSPQLLRLKVGESKRLGGEIQVRRGALTLTDQCTATSSDPDLVRVDRDTRSLVGVAPGSALVTLDAQGGSAILRVEVEGVAANEGRIVLEPNGGILGVGEKLPIRVFVVGPQGERTDRTAAAINKQSSDPQVLTIAPRCLCLTGIAPGTAQVSVEVPGIAEPAVASFRVEDTKFTELVVSPSPLRLAVGERQEFQVEAVGPSGRRAVGDHPDVKLVVAGANPRAADLVGSRQLRGVAAGEAELQVSWGTLVARPVPITVTYVPVSSIRIEPPTIDVAVGRRQPFRVVVTQGDQERSATEDDDVRLTIGDPTVASALRELAVQGVSPGATLLTAQLGPRRGTAQVRVSPSTGQDPVHDMPPGLRFIPDVLTMQLGVPGGPFRLVKVMPGGDVEDKRLQAQYEIFPDSGKEVVRISQTGKDGPVFVATKVGRAQVRATVDGETTPQPLVIQVHDPSQPAPGQGTARLEVVPDPVRLAVGAAERLRRVSVVPAIGEPVEVDYQIESANEQIVAVEDGTTLRALRAGQTRIKVTPRNVPAPWADLNADVVVNVESAEGPGPGDSPGATGRLVLSGPSRATVGAPAQYHVELAGDGGSRDVTHDNASLVIDKIGAAEAQAGCVLLPRQPTTLRLRARYKNLVSNDLQVRVDPPLSEVDVERLEMEIDPAPIMVGERRAYKVWGYPVGRGARRDLTPQVRVAGTDEASGVAVTLLLKPDDAAAIVTHAPQALVGKAPGEFRVAAQYGSVRSAEIPLRVVAADSPPASTRFVARPSAVTIRVGQHTPEITVTTDEGERSRAVDVAWTTENEQIAATDPVQPGRFIGRGIGTTKLRATFQGREVTAVDVHVTGDAFEDVRLADKPNPEKDNRFSVTATIQMTNSAEQSLEYRIIPAGQTDSDIAWKPAPIGEHQKLLLVSPVIRRGAIDAVYRLDIQARDKQQRIVAVYPLTFSLITGESITPQGRGGP